MNENVSNEKKSTKFLIIVIIISSLTVFGCSVYLINSFRLLKKYDVNSFKLGKFEMPTFNSAVKSKKKLVSASEKNGVTTLKYDIKKIVLNDVFAYLEKLSAEDYTIGVLEDLYMKVVKIDNDIQIKI